MAIPILDKDDFTGYIKLAVDTYQLNGFNDTVSALYEDFLFEVLGAFAIDKIKSLSTLPEIYTDLLDGVTFKDSSLVTHKFEGLQKIAKYIIYSKLRKEGNFLNTNTGDVSNKNENAVNAASAGAHLAIERYNKAVKMYKEIYSFIYVYRTIDGVVSVVTPGIDSQVLTLDTVKYIVVGSYVNIMSAKYEVLAVDYDLNTITISDTITVNPSDIIVWHPFNEMPITKMNYSCF